MAYTNNDIKEKALTLLGSSLRPGGEEVLGAVCEAAALEIKAKLRENVSPDDLGELFVTAAGMLAIAMYMEFADGSEGGIKSFSAGNLSASISSSAGIKASASSLREAAKNMLSAYLDNSDVCGFRFMGVDG